MLKFIKKKLPKYKKSQKLLQKGIGFFDNKNYTEAFLCFQQSYKTKPSILSSNYLGLCYLDGLGVYCDFKKSKEFLNKQEITEDILKIDNLIKQNNLTDIHSNKALYKILFDYFKSFNKNTNQKGVISYLLSSYLINKYKNNQKTIQYFLITELEVMKDQSCFDYFKNTYKINTDKHNSLIKDVIEWDKISMNDISEEITNISIELTQYTKILPDYTPMELKDITPIRLIIINEFMKEFFDLY
ncbi:MAG: hypothetical protein KGV48_001820 [Alcaligenaceae bacterium]|nr:hypothetical protein [Alcaligenaceae bacterium]